MSERATDEITDEEWRDRWPNFPKKDWRCKETGELDMSVDFLDKLQAMRTKLGFPLIVTSGFRSKKHKNERNKKGGGGRHTQGIALDVGIYGVRAFDVVAEAMAVGFNGVGISQREGLPRFIHLDMRPHDERTIYSY